MVGLAPYGKRTWRIELVLIIVAFICAYHASRRLPHALIYMFLSWFLLVSIQVRNPIILQGGDVVLRAIMFWMLFLSPSDLYGRSIDYSTASRPQEKQLFQWRQLDMLQIGSVRIYRITQDGRVA